MRCPIFQDLFLGGVQGIGGKASRRQHRPPVTLGDADDNVAPAKVVEIVCEGRTWCGGLVRGSSLA